MKLNNSSRIRKNIYIICEDFEKKIFLSREISQYGYQIYEFETILQAIPLARIKKPDVIVILYNNEEDNQFPISLAELIDITNQKSLIILLVNYILKTIEYDLYFKFIRIGISKIFYFYEQNQFININEILKEIDEFFELQYTNHKKILYVSNHHEFNQKYIEMLKKNEYLVDVIEKEKLKEIFFSKKVELYKDDYYLIILNLYYSDFLGIELAQIFRQYLNFKNIPIVFI